MKTNKSYMKRLRVTKKGKVIARPPGQCHFNAKATGTQNQFKKRRVGLSIPMSIKLKSRFLPAAK